MPAKFEKIRKSIETSLTGGKVSSKWRFKYGKTYSKSEAKQASYAITKAKFPYLK